MAWIRQAGFISDVIGCALALADIYIAQGRLRETLRIYEQALQLAAEFGTPTMRGTADMLVGMSELYREQNDLHAAIQYLQRSKEQGEHTGLPQNPYRWSAALARIREIEGDLNGALDLLNEAERLYVVTSPLMCGQLGRRRHGCGSFRAGWEKPSAGRANIA